MQSEWKNVRLGQLGRIVTGKTPATEDAGNFGGPIPFLTPSDFVDGQRRVKTARTLSQQGVLSVRNCLVPRGVAVSCIGWQMGKSVLVDEPTVTNQQINTVVPDENLVDTLFLYYSLASIRNKIFELGATSTRTPIVNKSTFSSIEISLPAPAHQRVLSGLLGALDDRIDLLRQTNSTLECLAQALFKSWFIDFDPVRANAESREPEDIDAATAAMFPAEFEESALGSIPKGWKVEPLGRHLADLFTGRRPKGGVAGISEGVPSIGAESIYGIGTFDFGKLKLVPREFFDGMRAGKPRDFDVLLYKDGGKPGHFMPRLGMFGRGFPFTEYAINEHVFALRAHAPLSQPFLYFWMKREATLEILRGLGNKAAIPGINRSDVEGLPLLIPSEQASKRFSEFGLPLIDRMLENAKQSQALSQLRDNLLPRLISGKLRLPEAQEQLEDALT